MNNSKEKEDGKEYIKKNNGNIMENTNKIIEQAKEIAINGIPEECQQTAKKFFDCIHEELKPFNEDGRIYTSQELQEILENEVIPKCKSLYDIDKCLEQYNLKNNDDSNEEEEEEEEELKL